MTKPTMTSQWDPGSYKPLDMSKIPGYPRQMPPISKRWFPKFTGGNGEGAEFHMRNFILTLSSTVLMMMLKM
jgi:hypothetical protein